MLHGTMNCVNLSTFHGPSSFNSSSSSSSSSSSCSSLTSLSSIPSSSPLMTTNCPSPSSLSSQFDHLESLWPKHIDDEVSNLALQACHQEVKRVSDNLRISPDPYTWTVADVISWISWQQKQFGLPMFPLSYFHMDGMRLCSLSEVDFKVRAQGAGDLLYAQLEIWKTLSEQEAGKRSDLIVTSDYGSDGIQSDDELSQDGACEVSSPSSMSPSSVSSSTSSVTFSPFPSTPSPLASPSSTSHSPSMVPGNSTVTPSPNRNTSGSHIHLWQFLKELLGQSQYGACIRWIDRSKGIFKIEDSVRVAKLWGRRKNRPAMNYDKLSRSIRQYYKKGIMKKTERSQRLVYQFCQPYCF